MTNSKNLKLQALYKDYQNKIDEHFQDTLPHQFVWGFGSPDSKVILIGEAPGKDEVIQGRPFVGKAGQMLTDFLNGAGLNRDDLFITNTVTFIFDKGIALFPIFIFRIDVTDLLYL